MAFKLKGMGFGEGTGYKSPQMMKKESAMKMAKKSAMKKANKPPKPFEVSDEKQMKRQVTKKLTPKSRATDRTPQSQMTDTERAAVKGISKPQSVKPTPPSRRYGDSPNNMAKKSAMKKKDNSNVKSTSKKTRVLPPKEAMLRSAIQSGVIPNMKNFGRNSHLSKHRTVDGKKVKIYDSEDIMKNKGESQKDYLDRVKKSKQKEYRKTFKREYEDYYNKKK